MLAYQKQLLDAIESGVELEYNPWVRGKSTMYAHMRQFAEQMGTRLPDTEQGAVYEVSGKKWLFLSARCCPSRPEDSGTAKSP